MRTISIVNLKGGVGKTVTAVNMAAVLAESGKRVLVIDADAQANSTRFMGLRGSKCKSLADVLSGEYGGWTDCVYATGVDGVECVPASIKLIEADIASVRKFNNSDAIVDFLDEIEEDERIGIEAGAPIAPYDFCVIDCPPSFTASSVAAIAASDDVIIPVKIDAFALDGLNELVAQIDGVKSIRPQIRIAGVLVTMWHNCPACAQGEELLRGRAVPCFRTHIRRSDKVDESTFARVPLTEYSANCAAAVDYKRFVGEYLEGVR